MAPFLNTFLFPQGLVVFHLSGGVLISRERANKTTSINISLIPHPFDGCLLSPQLGVGS